MTKDRLLECLDTLKEIMKSAATYGVSAESQQTYKIIRREILNENSLKGKVPQLIMINPTTNEFRTYMQGKSGGYAERRDFINNEINKLILYIENNSIDKEVIFNLPKTGWEKIDDSSQILIEMLNNWKDRISFNEIGVRCRETIIMLAQEVYDDKLHHPIDFPGEISKTDSKKMLDGYIQYNFQGSSCEEKKAYAKSCNILANYLTHSKNLTETDAKICITATLSLIQIVKAISKIV